MARRTSKQWQHLIQEQATSGQTAAAFCAARGINDKYFSLWKNKLNAKSKKTAKLASKFVEIKSPTVPAEAISLSVGSAVLKIPSSTSPQWLASLIRELG